MTPITEKILPPPIKNKWANRWILIIFLVLPLLAVTRITPALSSNAPILGNLLGTPSLSPTATATATTTSTPTATQTASLSSTPQTIVRVSGDYVNLRTGPAANFAIVRLLSPGEPLIMLGRVNDNTWLYVKASDGKEGWVNAVTVNLAGINLDAHPIKTLFPSTQLTVQVSGVSVNLRTGPRANFPKVQQLTLFEPLILLGRLSDNTWLYVKPPDGKEGWVKATSVYLAGINLDSDYLPVATSPPTPTATFVVLVGIKDRWIDIDLSDQMLRAYDDTDLVELFPGFHRDCALPHRGWTVSYLCQTALYAYAWY